MRNEVMLKRRGVVRTVRCCYRIVGDALTSSGLATWLAGPVQRSQLATSFVMKSASLSETLDDCESDITLAVIPTRLLFESAECAKLV